MNTKIRIRLITCKADLKVFMRNYDHTWLRREFKREEN